MDRSSRIFPCNKVFLDAAVQAEVRQLDLGEFSLFVNTHEHISCLQVVMYDAVSVTVLGCFDNLTKDWTGLRLREGVPPVLQKVVEGVCHEV